MALPQLTPEQRAEALASYASFSRNLQLLKYEFSPKTRRQQKVLSECRAAIKALKIELSKPLAWIDAARLNALEEAARRAMIEYMRVCMNKE